ncbi:uncharacterized protein LOC131045757 isoform X2 [Cryptomeria japonica]|uniref:uncharacterized protein LOC131045757 isoform X2 n=1 Tax=Cryptomeria japonica TaxID=3369 RepID=UPI0027DA67CC|nr:uncharacterized protein LOC131045757 isoform X2 [Cryptomeria japonica]
MAMSTLLCYVCSAMAKANSLKDGLATALMDYWVAINTVISVAIYFFDFVTNILTAIEYHELDFKKEKPTYGCEGKEWYKGIFTGMFTAIIFVMVASQILNAIVFWVSGDVKKGAMKTAFLLPLIHLRRMILFIRSRGTIKGAGVFSLCAVTVRCIGFQLLIALAVDSGGEKWVGHLGEAMRYCIPYLVATILMPAFFFLGELRKTHLSNLRSLLLCIAFTYMNFVIGPLYMLLKIETKKGKDEAKRFQPGLKFLICFSYVVPDLVLGVIVRMKPHWYGCSPCSPLSLPYHPHLRFPVTIFSCSQLTVYLLSTVCIYWGSLLSRYVMEKREEENISSQQWQSTRKRKTEESYRATHKKQKTNSFMVNSFTI